MSYSYQTSDQDREWKSGLAVSPDGVRWQKVERLPEALPPPERLYPFHGTVSEQAVDPSSADPVVRGYFDNPDRTDPAKRFMRMIKCGEVWLGQRLILCAVFARWQGLDGRTGDVRV